jgi:hypothetical protein
MIYRICFINPASVADLTENNMSNDIPASENPLTGQPRRSPGIMFITLLLLISGLLLSGFMMIYYSKAYKEQAPKTATNPNRDRQTSAQLGSIPEQTESAPLNSENPEIQPEAKNGIMNQLFGAKSDSVRWPKMKLTGFGIPVDGSGGFAIINNQQYHVGQLIGGKAKLIEVRKHDVVIEMAGETNILTVGLTD